MRPLVLASGSRYRQELLSRLQLEFTIAVPDVDESPLPTEPPAALAARLATAKAAALRGRFPDHLIIGSDQVAELDGLPIGKPGNAERAFAQLTAASGRAVRFHTGLCLLDSRIGNSQTVVEPFTVYFRTLSAEQIRRYLEREQPFDCAGSFKVEGLGIALFDRLDGADPNALIGLPLIRLVSMLAAAGVVIP